MNVRFEYQGVQFICLDWGTDATSVVYPETLDFLTRALDNRSAVRHPDPSSGSGGRRAGCCVRCAEMPRFWELVPGKRVMGVADHVRMTHRAGGGGHPVLTLRSTSLRLQAIETRHAPAAALSLVTIHNDVLTSRIFEVPLSSGCCLLCNILANRVNLRPAICDLSPPTSLGLPRPPPHGRIGHTRPRAMAALAECRVCPRGCAVDRLAGGRGACNVGAEPVVAFLERSHVGGAAHQRDARGSGTVFFSGCTGKCRFCQSFPISHARLRQPGEHRAPGRDDAGAATPAAVTTSTS